MKKTILIIDEDNDYSKKFCSQANKLYGKKYIFLTFSNIKSVIEYIKSENVEALILSESFLPSVEDVYVHTFYILNETMKKTISEGKKKYIYRLQNIKNILEIIDIDIEKRYENNKRLTFNDKKMVLFYATEYIKCKNDIVKKMAKYLSKKKKVLIVELDEFDNYKGNVGLSNIIFDYKENKISYEKIEKEVIEEKGLYFIKSVTYADDFNVVSNVDIANIVNEIMNLSYDYIFVNADTSFTKSEYLFIDADKIILLKENNSVNNDKFKNYVKNENITDMKKICELNVTKIDRTRFTGFVKSTFGSDDEK